jgi:hypothetical protein
MNRIQATHLVSVCAFLLIMGVASAATINASSEIAANVAWSFSVDLDPSNQFERTVILVDDTPLLDVYFNGNIIKDPFNGAFVLNAFTIDRDIDNPGGLVAYVNHPGLVKGTHTIKAQVYQNSSIISQEEHTLAITDTFEKITEIVTASNTLAEKIDELSTKLDALKTSTDEGVLQNTARIGETLAELNAINENVQQVSDNLQQQQSIASTQGENLDSVSASLIELKNQVKEENVKDTVSNVLGGTALAGLSSLALDSAAGVMVELIAIAILLVFIKKRHKGNEMDLVDGLDDVDNQEIDDMSPSEKSRWAFGKEKK